MNQTVLGIIYIVLSFGATIIVMNRLSAIYRAGYDAGQRNEPYGSWTALQFFVVWLFSVLGYGLNKMWMNIFGWF